VARDGSGNFTAGTITAALTGNASTATALETARTIGGVSFDGTANINLPGVNTAGNQDTTGNAATVTTNADLTGDVTSVGNATSIAAGVIVDADVNASAAIAGTKISPDFGSQAITTTGVISPALGTAALPSVAFTGDLNTGIFSPGADQVAISTNGTGRLFVAADGSVGIGHTPTAIFSVLGTARVQTSASGSVGYEIFNGTRNTGISSDFANSLTFIDHNQTLVFRDSQNAYAERMRLDSSGRLGLGTSSPAASSLLCLGGSFPTSSSTTYAFTNNGTIPSSSTVEAAAFLSNYNTQDAAVTYSWLAHYIAAQGTITGGSRLGVTSQAGFQVNNSLTGATNNYGFYSNIGTGTGRWNFYAAGTANNYFAGSVGIGTTSPDERLHIQGSSSTAVSEHIQNTESSVNYYSTVCGTGYSFSGVSGAAVFLAADANMAIGPYASGKFLQFIAAGTERARIDSSGRLLVGTSSQSGGSLLQVNDNRIRIATAKTPASASDTGTAGEICWDADYIYVCTATDTWKRTAISTW
jgi:hypothetical protein